MLKKAPVMVTFSADNLEKAKKFYSEVLGLTVSSDIPGMLMLHVEGSSVGIYEKSKHKPATYTVLNFTVTDVKKAMNELKKKGVVFIHYKPSEVSEKDPASFTIDEDGMADFGQFKIAFFNDPAGNNLSIMQM